MAHMLFFADRLGKFAFRQHLRGVGPGKLGRFLPNRPVFGRALIKSASSALFATRFGLGWGEQFKEQ
jgi:hypothetical protein